jgi:hypothetical protein
MIEITSGATTAIVNSLAKLTGVISISRERVGPMTGIQKIILTYTKTNSIIRV